MRVILEQEQGVEIDYVEVADPDRLAPLERMEGRIVLLLAVRLGGIRLIDNLLLLC